MIGANTNLYLHKKLAVQDANALSPAVQQAIQLTQPPSCTAFTGVAIHGPI